MRHKKNKTLEILKKFWEKIIMLPFGRRISFFAAIFAILALFLPWFYQGSISFSAFGKTFFFGVIILLCSIFSLLLILREVIAHNGVIGKYKHSDLLIIFFSQALFTVILANTSLSTLLLEKTEYATGNMGIMITFVSLGIGLAGAIFSKDYMVSPLEKKQVFVQKHDVDFSNADISVSENLSLGDFPEK